MELKRFQIVILVSFSYAGQFIMKFKLIFVTLFISLLSVTSYQLYGQEIPNNRETTEVESADSLKQAEKQLEQAQKEKDAATIENAKNESSEANEIAKEAQRVEKDANKSADAAKKALRTEKKAQKARTNADKQADKAYDAKEKSDKNY